MSSFSCCACVEKEELELELEEGKEVEELEDMGEGVEEVGHEAAWRRLSSSSACVDSGSSEGGMASLASNMKHLRSSGSEV